MTSRYPPTIGLPQFFEGKRVFVTGGTGFMGKVLLSKLLRSLQGTEKIYVLIRPNRGKSAMSRLKEILTLPLFEAIPTSQLDKVVPVEGDMLKLRLGVNDGDYETLTRSVSLVYHVAATVRFNEPLTTAILMNTRATSEVVKLCLKMKQLLALVHVSTTYCNAEWKTVEEKVYPAPVDWQDAVEIVDKLEPAVINTFSAKYIGEKSNTYTFTKSLAEQVVWDHKHLLPVIVFRPSIVVSTWKDPMPGWLDNLNGPVAMMLGAGQGLLRVTMLDPDVVPDYMPVDVAIRAILVASYVKGIMSSQVPPDEFVINCASASASISNKALIDMGLEMVKDVPLTHAMWVPSNDTTTSMTYFTIKSWFAHLLPAILIDFLLRMMGKKPRLVNIQRKIFVAISALSYFTCREWTFKNGKFLNLLSYILPEDKEEFDFDFRDIQPNIYFKQCILGARTYLLRDPIENIPAGKKRSERLYWINKFVQFTLLLFVVWLVDLPRNLPLPFL